MSRANDQVLGAVRVRGVGADAHSRPGQRLATTESRGLRVTKGRRAAALLLLAAALALAALGQYYFFRRREFLWDGVVFHALAVLCFVLAWRQASPRKSPPTRRRSWQWGAWLRERPIPAALVAVGLFCSSIAALLSRDRVLSQATGDVAGLWILGVSAVGAAIVWPAPGMPPAGRAALRIQRETWLEIAGVAGVTALALILRVTALESIPFTVGGDEAWHGQLARRVLSGQLQNPFNMGYMSMPTMFYWPLSWSLWLVGDSVSGLRLPAALVGTATIPVLYLFARRLWGRRVAFLSAAFLATYDYHIHYSRLGANNVWDPLFVVLTLWALDRGLTEADRTQQYRYCLLAGLMMGLSTFFYTGARLLPLLAATYVGFVWLRRRKEMEGLGPALVLLVLGFLVAGGPMLSFAVAHPGEWNARLNQVGIIQSGWLAREPGLTGKSTLYILAEQFVRAAGAFHVYPDRTVWYGADRPLLDPVSGGVAILGMAWAVAHWRERRQFLVLLWFWAVIISGGMLTESPPSSQRLAMAIPAVALLVATGLEQTATLAWRLAGAARRRWQDVVLGLAVLALGASNVWFYFVEFTPTRRYGSRNGETATMMGHYLRDLEGDYQAFFLGAPRMYWSFGTMSFLAPDVPGVDLVEPLTEPPDLESEGRSKGVVFLFLPERVGELVWVQQAYPDGIVRQTYDSAGELRFMAYEVPP
jgi:4-amino-4-deoxy-L-arabinose transferase-like glycosyltransferase